MIHLRIRWRKKIKFFISINWNLFIQTMELSFERIFWSKLNLFCYCILFFWFRLLFAWRRRIQIMFNFIYSNLNIFFFFFFFLFFVVVYAFELVAQCVQICLFGDNSSVWTVNSWTLFFCSLLVHRNTRNNQQKTFISGRSIRWLVSCLLVRTVTHRNDYPSSKNEYIFERRMEMERKEK